MKVEELCILPYLLLNLFYVLYRSEMVSGGPVLVCEEVDIPALLDAGYKIHTCKVKHVTRRQDDDSTGDSSDDSSNDSSNDWQRIGNIQ